MGRGQGLKCGDEAKTTPRADKIGGVYAQG